MLPVGLISCLLRCGNGPLTFCIILRCESGIDKLLFWPTNSKRSSVLVSSLRLLPTVPLAFYPEAIGCYNNDIPNKAFTPTSWQSCNGSKTVVPCYPGDPQLYRKTSHGQLTSSMLNTTRSRESEDANRPNRYSHHYLYRVFAYETTSTNKSQPRSGYPLLQPQCDTHSSLRRVAPHTVQEYVYHLGKISSFPHHLTAMLVAQAPPQLVPTPYATRTICI
jgi:hypothetical protein